MGAGVNLQTRRALLKQFAPQYRKASSKQKRVLLDAFAQATGYHRRYGMWLLNHAEEVKASPRYARARQYGPEVQRVLVLLWQAANCSCTKRLMPYLPTLVDALERHEHLQITKECRAQLLAMSAATADRLLRTPRERGPHGIATTCAGTLLKQQIPIRTFQQWNETDPGFLEADLVAHCGSQIEGSFLYTLTLTDIATGWTECLPLRSRSAEAVLSALQQARRCFPFPVLGLDTDNGCEFINEHLLAYCEAEQITFTRGRPDLKNDQCYVEQKNRAIVRQVVGYARLEGERVYRQLGEVYQALRLYVNGFQPSMKLQAKQYDGRKMHRVYDAAKTPLQRLLLAQVLPARGYELARVAQVLDPLRLFRHLQDLQQALFSLTNASLDAEGSSPVAILPFCVETCIAGSRTAAPEAVKEPRKEQAIYAAVLDRVLPDQPEQEAECRVPSTGTSSCSSPVLPSQQIVEESSFPSQPAAEEEATTSCVAASSGGVPSDGQPQASLTPESLKRSHHKPSDMTIEQAVQDYLEDQRSKHRRPKTLQWHQQALRLFQRYLLTEHQCTLLGQITDGQVRSWLAFLPQMPTARGSLRSTSTIESYTRSARAFCQWVVRHRYMQSTPFSHLRLPEVKNRLLRSLEPEEWEQLLLACRPSKTGVLAERATARNRSILWLLFETGMRVSEVCALRLGDVDPEQGILRVRGKDSKERRLTLGQEGLRCLLAYLDEYRLGAARCVARGGASEGHLFLSESGRPLTKNGMSLLFGRLRKRAGFTRKGIQASLLRESFAARYLQVGGDLCTLWELLGQKESALVNYSLHLSGEVMGSEKRLGRPEGRQR